MDDTGENIETIGRLKNWSSNELNHMISSVLLCFCYFFPMEIYIPFDIPFFFKFQGMLTHDRAVCRLPRLNY